MKSWMSVSKAPTFPAWGSNMKPTRLPKLKLHQKQYLDGIRVVGYWAVLYIIALAVVLADCIVWRP